MSFTDDRTSTCAPPFTVAGSISSSNVTVNAERSAVVVDPSDGKDTEDTDGGRSSPMEIAKTYCAMRPAPESAVTRAP